MWTIVDKTSGRPYIPRTWKTEQEAQEELLALLAPYEEASEWRCRLVVRSWKKPILVTGIFRGDGDDGRSKVGKSKPRKSS